MQIGIGFPNTLPGTPEWMVVDWTRKAEESGCRPRAPCEGSQSSRQPGPDLRREVGPVRRRWRTEDDYLAAGISFEV